MHFKTESRAGIFSQPKTAEVIYSDFLAQVAAGQVAEVIIQGSSIRGKYTNGQSFQIYAPDDKELMPLLRQKGVRIAARPPQEGSFWGTLLGWIPMLLFVGIWIFVLRKMQSGGGISSFGKSRHKISGQNTGVTFADVAGVEEAKAELREVVEFLKNPSKFSRLGGRIPKGILLVGPTGTGKTYLAKAVAGEAGVPFFSISGSDFVEMIVGVGASRVRDLFEQGKNKTPCIIFIDEIDAVGRSRGAGLGWGHDEREQTLNQLLVELDGFETQQGIIVLAATNRSDVLDPALLRPGRFDRQVVVDKPDLTGREAILRVHAKKIKLAPEVKLDVVARATPGLVGADLENIVNEAALRAACNDQSQVEMKDFEYAVDKIELGLERRTMVMSEAERKTIAYHEAGHTLIAKALPQADPVRKVTIIPRGKALGVTYQLPAGDRYNYSKDFLLGRITVLLGGRAAEEVKFQQFTTGAADDLERATELARNMVCVWGMSEELGPRTFGKKEELMFLAREVTRRPDYSEETARLIDAEVKKIIDEGLSKARLIMRENFAALERLAEALLRQETLNGEEVEAIWRAHMSSSTP